MLVQCGTCGKEFDAYPSAIKAGRGKFCSRGCRPYHLHAVTHGMSRTRLYVAWSDMKSRCQNPRNVGHPYYGARGITVCPEWEQSFETFRDWALASGYTNELELDRKDADGNYGPENCRWATRRQQMANTRKRRDAKTSAFKGVSWCTQRGLWQAQIVSAGRNYHLGMFEEEADAARAYDEAARRHFGEFARPNFR